jgi:phosphoinositide-3-kinase regulatory subunit 4
LFIHHFVASISDPFFATNNPNHHIHLSSNSTPFVSDADARIDQVYMDFKHIANISGIKMTEYVKENHSSSLFPYYASIPGFHGPCNLIHYDKANGDLGLIFISILCSSLRNCIYSSSKMHAIDLLLVLGLQIPDEFKLDRVVPFLISLLNDSSTLVRVNSLVALAQLVNLIFIVAFRSNYSNTNRCQHVPTVYITSNQTFCI